MAKVETKHYTVKGFHCSGCAESLGSALARLDGIVRAEADFDEGRVEVRYDPARLSDADIREGIRRSGFEPV